MCLFLRSNITNPTCWSSLPHSTQSNRTRSHLSCYTYLTNKYKSTDHIYNYKLRPPEEDLETSRNIGILKLLVVLLSPMIWYIKLYILYTYMLRNTTHVCRLPFFVSDYICLFENCLKTTAFLFYKKKTSEKFANWNLLLLSPLLSLHDQFASFLTKTMPDKVADID